MKNDIETLKNEAKQELEEENKYNIEISDKLIEKYYMKIENKIQEKIKKAFKENKKYCFIFFYKIDEYINLYKEENKNNVDDKKIIYSQIEHLFLKKIINNLSKKYIVRKKKLDDYSFAILLNNSRFTKIKLYLWGILWEEHWTITTESDVDAK